GALPCDLSASACRQRACGQCQLIPGDRELAHLIGAAPVRERARLDVNRYDAVRLLDRICSEIRHRTFGSRLVLLSRALRWKVDGVFGAVRPHHRNNEMAASVENRDALRTGAVGKGLAAVPAYGL